MDNLSSQIVTGVYGHSQLPMYFWDAVAHALIGDAWGNHVVNCRECFNGGYCEESDMPWEEELQYYGADEETDDIENALLVFSGTAGVRAYNRDPKADFVCAVRESVVQVTWSRYAIITEWAMQGTFPGQAIIKCVADGKQVGGNEYAQRIADAISNGIVGQGNINLWSAFLSDLTHNYAAIAYALPPDLYDEDHDDMEIPNLVFPVEDLEKRVAQYQSGAVSQ